jgi:hypothetical protein
VEVDYEACSRLVHDCVAIHVAPGVAFGHGRQASLHLVREGLDPSIPSLRKFSGPIVSLRESGWQLALVVILSNYTQVLFTEAFVAVAAMAIPILIVVVSPMFPPMVVVGLPSLGGLW